MSLQLQLKNNIRRPDYENVTLRYMSTISASAARHPTGQSPGVGLYWTRKGQDPEIAFMLVLYSGDFSEHYLAGPLASRGFGVLGYATRYRAMQEGFILEKALDDIAAGTKWLMENTAMKKLVFIGNSGGGSLMAAFQARAERDTSLRGAHAFIFLNAHPGRADVLTDWLDPSVIDEDDPTKRDSSLDMYNPTNGPPYSTKFQSQYREAQRQRNRRITAWAKAELKRLNEAGIEDRMFTVYRTSADLRFTDPTIDPSDRPSPACLHGNDPEKANRGLGYLARANTLETFLSMWSLEESKSRFKLQAAAFSLPTLVIQSTHDVSVFPSMAQSIYDLVGSKNKELRWVPGAHYFEDSKESLENVANLITEWTTKTLSQ
jgi:pimeloyl-ACP methyl ester carboxylesterase